LPGFDAVCRISIIEAERYPEFLGIDDSDALPDDLVKSMKVILANSIARCHA
jgi:hypothetical protein